MFMYASGSWVVFAVFGRCRRSYGLVVVEQYLGFRPSLAHSVQLRRKTRVRFTPPESLAAPLILAAR
eukprot:262785-Alexandrium_andersonii.AAC.1